MDPADVYRFDLRGYLVLREVLSPQQVLAANAAIDYHQESRTSAGQPNPPASAFLQSAQDMLGWEEGLCTPFRDMIAHSRLVPILNTLCGPGFRMGAFCAAATL